MSQVGRNDRRDAWMAAALRSRAEHSLPRNDCPHPERIWDAVRLQVSVDQRVEIIDHLAECPTCAEAWTIAVELVTAHEELEQPRVAAFEPTSVYRRAAMLIAAPMLLLVALGIAFIVNRPASPTGAVSTESAPTAQASPAQTVQQTPSPVPAPAPDRRPAQAPELPATPEIARPPQASRAPARGIPAAQRAPRTATTPDTPPLSPIESDENAIRRVVATYKTAIETKDVSLFLSIRPGLSAEEQARLRASFDAIVSQQIAIAIDNIQVDGTTAMARISRKDVIIVNGEQRQTASSRQTFRFVKSATGWILTSIDR